MSRTIISRAALLLPFAVSLIAPAAATYDQSKPGAHYLAPAIRWDLDTTSLEYLIPRTEGPLYYADTPGVQDPHRGHKYINIDANYTKPTVVLEHSKYISDVKCTGNGMTITFSNTTAYEGVKLSWNQVPNDEMGIVSYIAGCGQSVSAKRSFWHTSSLSFVDQANGGVALVQAYEVEAMQALGKSRVSWGDYQPSLTSRNPPSMAAVARRASISSGVYTINASPPNDSTFMGQAAHKIFGVGDDGSGGGGGGGATPTPTPGIRRRSSRLHKRTGFGVYCVGCSATGQYQFSGSADVGLSGLSNVEATFSGQLSGTMVLGVAASAPIPVTSYNKTLTTIPLSPFGVDGIISIGPQIDLLASVSLSILAAGEVMGGATVNVGPFQAEAGSTTSSSGFTPSFQTTDAKGTGSIGLKATFGIPVQLGFGITAVGFTKTVNIQDEPSIALEGVYEGAGTGSCSKGIELTALAQNDVTLNIPFLPSISIDHEQVTLASTCAKV